MRTMVKRTKNELWLRLAACPEGSLERRCAAVVKHIGLSGLAAKCGVSNDHARGWFEDIKIPEQFADVLNERIEGLDFGNSLVDQYVELRDEGMSSSEIAAELGVTRQAVHKALKKRGG
jgi:hypothetical protein